MYLDIEIPFSFYAKHKYKNAPKEVKFLRQLHPHDFDCIVWIEVFDEERELEFFLVREKLNKMIPRIKVFIAKQGYGVSCESIARFILAELQKEYSTNRGYKIRVSEDGKYAANIQSSGGVL